MTKEELLDSGKSLSKEQRIDLVMDLWATIETDDLPLSKAQEEELDRRIAADDADTGPGEEWEDLKAKILREEF